MENKSKIELLAPAGSPASLNAAIAGGANAVYLGLGKFNARENANNFNSSSFKEAILLAKSNKVKTFFTANTLVKNSELRDFFNQLKYVYECGIDAVIIQDPGFIEIIKKSFPSLHIHMSTQAGVMNSPHANLFSAVERINLARELNKKNLELLRKNTKIELEVFVHGALCACISGSCLFSSLLGGRSGNRGKCAQPCRKMYNDKYLISTKELCLIQKLPEIINLGVNCLKIEGRMRSPYYVFTTSSIYRKAIDSFYNSSFKVTPEMKKELESAFSRDFTQGRFCEENIFNKKQSSGRFKQGQMNYSVENKKLNFNFPKAKNLEINFSEKNSSGKKLIVRVYNLDSAIIADKYADIICLDIFNKDFEKIKREIKKPLYAITPRIMFDSDIEIIKSKILELSPKGILAGNLGILNLNLNIPVILDYNANCFNDFSLKYYQENNASPIISPELSLEELLDFKNKDFIVFVHGKIRLMTLAHELPEDKVKDYRGFNFYIKKIFNGSEIINEKELGLFNKLRVLVKAGINQFYVDSESDNLEEILKLYKEILEGKTPDASKIQKNYVLGWSKQGVL